MNFYIFLRGAEIIGTVEIDDNHPAPAEAAMIARDRHAPDALVALVIGDQDCTQLKNATIGKPPLN